MQACGAGQPQVLSSLPTTLLAQVLQFVPQQERLSTCALVSHEFAAAANLATVSIEVEELPPGTGSALQSWIKQHAKQLVSIKYEYCDSKRAKPLQLPCAELLQLTKLEFNRQMLLLDEPCGPSTLAAASTGGMVLRSGCRQPAGSAQHAGQKRKAPGQHTSMPMQQPIQPLLLPTLQELTITWCTVSSVQRLLQLSTLTSLTSLELNYVSLDSTAQHAEAAAQQTQHNQSGTQRVQDLSAALCTLLPCLRRLEALELCLELPGTGLSRVVQQFSSLLALRSVGVTICEEAAHTDSLLVALPGGLTRLHVADLRGQDLFVGRDPRPVTLPQQLPGLSDLQNLELYGAVFDPTLLSSMARLQHLSVLSCTLLPGGRNKAAAADTAAAFLAAIGRMTDLVTLHCGMIDDDATPATYNAAQPAAYTALTASTKLRELVIDALEDLPLPVGAVKYMFPWGRVLPHLTCLHLEGTSSFCDEILNENGTAGVMSPLELSNVFAACPALVELYLCNALSEGVMSPFSTLPASATTLAVGGAAVGDGAAVVISKLTQLRCLLWQSAPGLTDVGLEQLTALKGLSRLSFFDVSGLSNEVHDDPTEVQDGTAGTVFFEVGPKNKSPVWQQLNERLDLSIVLALTRLQQHKQEKAQTQKQAEDLQQRVAQLEQQAAELSQQKAELQQEHAQVQQQLAGVQQQIVGLQQQLVGAHQRIAELKQHVADLLQRLN